MTVIKGRLGAVYLASIGAGTTTFTKDPMTANGPKTVFTADTAAHRFWDPSATTIVYYNDIANSTYQSIQYPGGVVTWAVTPGNNPVTVSGKYLAISSVAQARGFTIESPWDYADTTVFGDLFRVQTPILRASTVTIDTLYADETFFTEMTTAARVRCGFDLFVDATGGSESRWTGYGFISSRGVTAPVDGVIEEPLTITVNDGPYYVAGLA